MSKSLILGAPASCARPTYGRVLGADAVSGLLSLVFLGVGAGLGAVVGAASAPTDPQRGAMAGAFVGGAAGMLGGIYPNLLAQRGIIRSKSCKRPGIGNIFVYNLAKYGITAALSLGARAAGVAPAGAVTAFFVSPVVGKGIIKS